MKISIGNISAVQVGSIAVQGKRLVRRSDVGDGLGEGVKEAAIGDGDVEGEGDGETCSKVGEREAVGATEREDGGRARAVIQQQPALQATPQELPVRG